VPKEKRIGLAVKQPTTITGATSDLTSQDMEAHDSLARVVTPSSAVMGYPSLTAAPLHHFPNGSFRPIVVISL
jgi:hypothetical protein